MPILRILVATDGSPAADRAVTAAAELASGLAAELLIVTFGGSLSRAEMEQLARAEGGISEALDLLTKRILLTAKEQAAKIGAPKVRTWSGYEDPAEGIMEIARREQTDIIVAGRRGRGQLAGLLLGSV